MSTSTSNSKKELPEFGKSSKPEKLALVVDNDRSNVMILRAHLEQLGYFVVEAFNGQEAIDTFNKLPRKPDLIIMDVVMPVMDGYQATKIIKENIRSEYIPVIFITGLSEKATVQTCIENGGDDLILKPVNSEIFKSKIFAHERIRDLQSKVTSLYNEMLDNQTVAKSIYEKMLEVNNQQFDGIHKICKASDVFSGDIMLTAYTPSRDIHIVLADFTGHGMSAAIGALPVSMLFRQLCAQGVHIRDIIQKINIALYALLPTEMFMAAQFVRIQHDLKRAFVYNFSMPEVIIVEHETRVIKNRIESKGMALGIMEYCDAKEAECVVNIELEDRILMFTDGLTEYGVDDNLEFSEERIINIIQHSEESEYTQAIYKEIKKSNLEEIQHDDISMLEVHCTPDIIPAWTNEVLFGRTDTDEYCESSLPSEPVLDFSFSLYGGQLLSIDPVPVLSKTLRTYKPAKQQKQALYAIIQDLFFHALHESIAQKLEIDSSDLEINSHRLVNEFVKFSLYLAKYDNKYQFKITVKDSGVGCDYSSLVKGGNINSLDSDVNLFRAATICQDISFSENGTRVSAVYEWEEYN